MSVILQPPQLTCAIWLAASGLRRLSAATPMTTNAGHAPCMARFTVLHTEHCTLDAPLMYISNVLQPPHSSCAISVPVPQTAEQAMSAAPAALVAGSSVVPAGGTGVMLLHCGTQKGSSEASSQPHVRVPLACARGARTPPKRRLLCAIACPLARTSAQRTLDAPWARGDKARVRRTAQHGPFAQVQCTTQGPRVPADRTAASRSRSI